ncbi:MAG TPA: hypothetical protein DCY88_29780, partial [Cyanobacteria bacterium UBA11372]|nr:hypothetical protein [Cyanobacteria bacterium UBA11372]
MTQSISQPISYEADFYRQQGVLLIEKKDYEEAIAFFDKALRLQPDYYDAWCQRGLALGHLGRHEEALTSFNNALAIQPGISWVWHNR